MSIRQNISSVLSPKYLLAVPVPGILKYFIILLIRSPINLNVNIIIIIKAYALTTTCI